MSAFVIRSFLEIVSTVAVSEFKTDVNGSSIEKAPVSNVNEIIEANITVNKKASFDIRYIDLILIGLSVFDFIIIKYYFYKFSLCTLINH